MSGPIWAPGYSKAETLTLIASQHAADDVEYAALGAAKNVFTGKAEINGGFVNGYDTGLWIAGSPRVGPIVGTQGFYVQHRIGGDLGAHVHDGSASELRITSGTNSTFTNALETTLEIGGPGTALNDARSITSNFVFDAGLTGTLTAATAIRAQALPALPAGFAIGTVYGLYVEPQTVGGVNYSVYAPTGVSVFGTLTASSLKASGELKVLGVNFYIRNATDTGTFFTIQSNGIPRWNDAGIQQITVGAAGGASAPPATPTKWLRVSDSAGNSLVIPAYASV